MLQAWAPPAWAFGGALATALQIGIGGYWMNSYFGGVLPALAGALLLGAIPRFLRKPEWVSASIFASSIVLLVNMRPFEGTVLVGVCLALAAFWRWKAVLGKPEIRWRIFTPAIVIAPTAALAAVRVFKNLRRFGKRSRLRTNECG